MGFVRDFSDSIRLGFGKMFQEQDYSVSDFEEVIDSKAAIQDAKLTPEEINILRAPMKDADDLAKDISKRQAGSVVLHASDMVIQAKTKLGFLLKRGKANKRLRTKLAENMPKQAKEPAVRLPKDETVKAAESTNNGTNYGYKKDMKTEPREHGGKYRDSRSK